LSTSDFEFAYFLLNLMFRSKDETKIGSAELLEAIPLRRFGYQTKGLLLRCSGRMNRSSGKFEEEID
ncbi:MAG: hypothetical protein PVH42_14500, partial [Desulfobacterales bacterium]